MDRSPFGLWLAVQIRPLIDLGAKVVGIYQMAGEVYTYLGIDPLPTSESHGVRYRSLKQGHSALQM